MGKDKILTGVFADGPVQGLEYQTQTLSGVTNARGEFQYRAGETVTFSVGGLVVGSAPGGESLTPAHLAVEVGGDIRMLKKYAVTSIARFLQSLDEDGNVENGVTVTEKTRSICEKYVYRIDFEQNEADFTADADVQALFAELGKKLRTGPQARNHLRRTLYGIRKTTDVAITMRDGIKLYADVLAPLDGGKYPAILCLGPFGKCFHDGSICDEAGMLEKEVVEDNWFEGNPSDAPWGLGPMPWEKGEGVRATDWVPRGYAVVRIDGRCIGKSEGSQEMFSLQEVLDIYDSVEWATRQPWCDGKVGLWGTGLYGSNSLAAASLQPPGLKAVIPVCPDIDPYRDFIFIGGLWMGFQMVLKNTCREWEGVDWIEEAKKHHFYSDEYWGFQGKLIAATDMGKVKVPVWFGMGESGTLHNRGTSEAYTHLSHKNKKMTIISEPGVHYWAYEKGVVKQHIDFMDYWLKGKKNGIMDGPPIKMMVRTGRKGYYWQDEYEWPIARTQYTRYHLNAAPSNYPGDGRRADFLTLQKDAPGEEKSATYTADAEWQVGENWKQGVSFITEPMAEDVVLAGHMKLAAWVSSTTSDMALHCELHVMDGENDIIYPIAMGESTGHKRFPLSFGALKVSHRKLDPEKSTDYRPYHTHLEEDCQPLTPGEAVPVEVEIWPTTALVRKGWRLRLDVRPVSGDYIPFGILEVIDDSYRKGAANTIYTGPEHPSYLQLPVVPPRK